MAWSHGGLMSYGRSGFARTDVGEHTPADPTGEWVFEPKLDGWRCLVYVDETVTVRTRTGRDIAQNVAHLRGLAGLAVS
jgi:ATP-dependent DNA ligase